MMRRRRATNSQQLPLAASLQQVVQLELLHPRHHRQRQQQQQQPTPSLNSHSRRAMGWLLHSRKQALAEQGRLQQQGALQQQVWR
jgi:hypothetical protein